MAGWRDQLTADGCTRSTLDSYRRMMERAAAGAGWKTVADINHQSAVAFLASRARGDHGGKPWGPATRRIAVHALQSFSEYLRASRLVPASPLCDITPPKRADGQGKHAFTPDEGRAFMASALGLFAERKRIVGQNPPLWFYFSAYTGLRWEETRWVEWSDMTLEGDLPGLRCRTWDGNKAKRSDWLPLRPSLVRRLLAWREVVPGARVFPIVPTPVTFDKIAGLAGLPKVDDDGRKYSPHSTRATYITWLGQQAAIPEGLRQRLARHKSLTETTYTARGKAEMAEAVALLPEIWPESVPVTDGGPGATDPPPKRKKRPSGPGNTPDSVRSGGNPEKRLASGRESDDIGGQAANEHFPNEQRRPPTAQSWLPPPTGANGAGDDGGPTVQQIAQSSGSMPVTPVTETDIEVRAVIELLGISQTLRDLLARRQPPSGS